MFSFIAEFFAILFGRKVHKRTTPPYPADQATQTSFTQPPNDTYPPMDQGDYHSGPEGYSPNTAYPETQYGSMFDEEAEWNEENQ